MDRNTEIFGFVPPSVDLQRSSFNLNHKHLTTMNAGKLVPIYCEDVLPGDTFSLDMSSLIRMSTSIFPTMDNAYFDVYFFFVPNRIVWDHWRELMGENRSSAWTQPVEYKVPMIKVAEKTSDEDVNLTSIPGVDSIADHFGIPVGVGNIEFSALPFRAYCQIWNEWFRDQNLMNPAYCPTNDDDTYFFSSIYPGTDLFNIQYAHTGSHMLPVCKYHDYFTSALPQPQKSAPVEIPLFEDGIPVGTSDLLTDSELLSNPMMMVSGISNNPLKTYFPSLDFGTTGSTNLIGYNPLDVSSISSDDVTSEGVQLKPYNLRAYTEGVATVTVNAMRTAFQIQKLFEKDARGGTRYREILKAHFGVTSPDSRMQIPEYLGGKRIPINMDQVLQTSESQTTPLGTTAGLSLTSDVSSMFTKSFTEHGYIIGVGCIRTDHTYQQGLRKHWSKKNRFDFYWPTLANIGEQAILNKELYIQGTNADDEAFGYQEAWAEYRYSPNVVTGQFRSNVSGSLDSWHYADNYPEQPILSKEWISETSSNIDRTLAVSSDLSNQFLCDFYFKVKAVRPMPLYSVPGLIDHN